MDRDTFLRRMYAARDVVADYGDYMDPTSSSTEVGHSEEEVVDSLVFVLGALLSETTRRWVSQGFPEDTAEFMLSTDFRMALRMAMVHITCDQKEYDNLCKMAESLSNEFGEPIKLVSSPYDDWVDVTINVLMKARLDLEIELITLFGSYRPGTDSDLDELKAFTCCVMHPTVGMTKIGHEIPHDVFGRLISVFSLRVTLPHQLTQALLQKRTETWYDLVHSLFLAIQSRNDKLVNLTAGRVWLSLSRLVTPRWHGTPTASGAHPHLELADAVRKAWQYVFTQLPPCPVSG